MCDAWKVQGAKGFFSYFLMEIRQWGATPWGKNWGHGLSRARYFGNGPLQSSGVEVRLVGVGPMEKNLHNYLTPQKWEIWRHKNWLDSRRSPSMLANQLKKLKRGRKIPHHFKTEWRNYLTIEPTVQRGYVQQFQRFKSSYMMYLPQKKDGGRWVSIGSFSLPIETHMASKTCYYVF